MPHPPAFRADPGGGRRPTVWVLAVVGILAVGSGCEEAPDAPPWHPPVDELVPTAPESVVVQLERAYRTRNIEAYAELLAPEFIFEFQPVDQNTIGAEFWTFDQDSIGTRGLLTTPEVSNIRIDLVHDPSTLSQDPQHQTAHPGARRILIKVTQLEVDQVGGITWVVTDQQEMFFYRGTPDAGQDTTRWFLFEWRDLPALDGAAVLPRTPLAAVETMTWGKLKSMYR